MNRLQPDRQVNGFDDLQEADRLILRRRYEHDVKAPDLARVLKTTPGAVRQSLLSIRAAVRRCIEARLGEIPV